MDIFGFSDSVNDSTERRISNVDANTPGLGLKRINLANVEEFDVLAFAYKAESPGFPKPGISPPNPNIFDANPLIVVMSIKLVKGRHIIYGLNVNYLMNRMDRGKLILSTRQGQAGNSGAYINESIFDRTIHCYRLDRIKSELFKPRNVIVDIDLLTSMANWKLINKAS